MYVFIESLPIKCGECESTNIARTVNNPQMSKGRLICLDCGHKGKAENFSLCDFKMWNFDTTKLIQETF